MKKIKFSCSNCDAKLRVPTHLAGVSAPCPKCGHTITAPMEIDSAVEEAATPRQRPTNRSAASGRSHSAPTGEGGSSTAVAEPPQAVERPRREVSPVSQPKAQSVDPDAAPQAEALDPAPEPEAIVTETFLKPKAETSLPAPVLPQPVEDVDEAPPAFPETFAPPPPAMPVPEAPSAYEPPPSPDLNTGHGDTDTDSDGSIFDLPELPVEEARHAEFSEPPALVKTQPIRTIERPSNLPPLHSAPQSGVGELPRLDVSLAGDTSSISNQGKILENAIGQGKTKLRLPQPGEESKRFTPADFIAPEADSEPAAPESEAELPEADPYPEPATVEPDESYTILDPEDPLPTSEYVPVPLDNLEAIDQPDVPEFPPIGEQSLDDLVIEDDSPEAPEWDPLAEPDLETAPHSLLPEESVEGDLDEGSFENLFAQQSGGQSVTKPTRRSIYSNREPASYQQTGDSPSMPSYEEPAPSQIAGMAAQPVLRKEAASSNDVLEEMFGSPKSSPFRLKKSTLVMIGVCSLLATIAIVIVSVAGSALGFWGDSPTTMDPVTEAPESMKPKEPDPEVEDATSAPGSTAAETNPDTEDVPAAINPGEAEKPENNREAKKQMAAGSTLSLPGDTETPVRIVDSSASAKPADPPAVPKTEASSLIGTPQPADEPEALSFDERVQNIVNGNGLNTDASAAMPETLNTPPPTSGSADFPAAGTPASAPSKVENYNPPPSFAAPGPEDGPLGKTHDIIDAFLRAPDWETRSKYVYQAESLMPTMEEYYKKWPDRRLDRYSHQLYAMESDAEFGGPYWVYLISQSDDDEGYPFIIRVEDGNLKVDWESHSEFFDQHWLKFQQGGIAVPHTFRVAVQRVSDYYGPDREQFENLDDYLVYKINPPYGGEDEFMEYAFVKKDSPLAAELDKVAGLGDEALAVMLTLDYEQFPHNQKHLVIRDYVSEGWFR